MFILQTLMMKNRRPAYPETVLVATFVPVSFLLQFFLFCLFFSDIERSKICSILSLCNNEMISDCLHSLYEKHQKQKG